MLESVDDPEVEDADGTKFRIDLQVRRLNAIGRDIGCVAGREALGDLVGELLELLGSCAAKVLYAFAKACGVTDGQTVKARDLSGANNLLFRRNSVSGAVEVVSRALERRGFVVDCATGGKEGVVMASEKQSTSECETRINSTENAPISTTSRGSTR